MLNYSPAISDKKWGFDKESLVLYEWPAGVAIALTSLGANTLWEIISDLASGKIPHISGFVSIIAH